MGDLKSALEIQKLVVRSNSARVTAIRNVTQISLARKIPGVDGKISLTFSERFELCEYIKVNFYQWKHQKFRLVNISASDGCVKLIKVPTISDRVWQDLVKIILDPAHEALFHPRNLGFRTGIHIYETQRILFLNLHRSSNPNQKRILKINLYPYSKEIDYKILLKSLIIPRNVKLSVFSCMNLGLSLCFSDSTTNLVDLSSIILNVSLHGIESIHPSVRFGYELVVFLKPLDNEMEITRKILRFFKLFPSSSSSKYITLVSALSGFDLLGWHFRVFNNRNFTCVPSFGNYQSFLRRVKHIVNNSNFGAKCDT